MAKVWDKVQRELNIVILVKPRNLCAQNQLDPFGRFTAGNELTKYRILSCSIVTSDNEKAGSVTEWLACWTQAQ